MDKYAAFCPGGNQHKGSRVCPEHYSNQQQRLLEFLETHPESNIAGEVHAAMRQSQIWLQEYRAQVS